MTTFPDAALDLRTELYLGGTWTDVSAYTEHSPTAISRGHPDESTTVSPSTLALTLSNNDARFSPDNPLSPYYPYLVQNTRCRISVPAQANYLRFETDITSNATCPDASGLHITGDIDIRIDLKPTSYAGSVIVAKWGASGNFGWLLEFDPTGTAQFFWSTTGSDFPSAVSTVPVPFGRLTLRVTLAVSTGTVTFWTGAAGNADSSSGWTQLGSAVVTGSTSIHASTAVIAAGGTYGNYYELEVRSGIGGTVVAHPVFSAQSAGTTSFSDAQGNTWTLNGTAELSARNYRFHGEIPEYPQHQTEFDPGSTAASRPVTVNAAGGGLLRRQSQRNNPVNSAMWRAWALVNSSLLAAYWPMEDGTNATQIASGDGGRPMQFSGTPKLASNSDFACSGALPVTNGAAFSGNVSYTGTWTDNQVAFLLEIPSGGEANGAVIAQVATTGNIASMVLSYGTGGSLTLTGYNSSGGQVFTSGAVAFPGLNGTQYLVAIALQNSPGGGSMTYHIDAWSPGATSPVGSSATFGGSPGAVTRVQLNPNGTLTGTVLGHCAVLTAYQQLYSLFGYVNPSGLVTGALNAWAGEPAGVRFARICSEEAISCRIRGYAGGTVLMGAQVPQTVTQLLQECADADRGAWTETRQALGWGYVCRSALYNQAAQVTVDYSQDHLSMWSADPVRDDQVIENDVTVSQSSGGSSSRQFAAPGQAITGGRLSSLDPSLGGAGVYDQNYQLNIYSAGDLDNEASWILHVGTTDQMRFPGIVLDLANRDLAGVFWQVLDMDLGDRLVINNPPPWLGPNPVSQIVQQLTETLWTRELTVTVAGVPEAPYEVIALGASHIDTDGTTLSAGVSSGATSMSFATASGDPLWSTSAGDYPCDVMIAGERVTVTAMSGSSSPQTATVTRSVNGVVKAQASAASVNVYSSPVLAL